MQSYKRLLEPIRIGNITLPNRIVMPAMGTMLNDPCGGLSEAQQAYYVERAQGGTGLIITEVTSVHLSGTNHIEGAIYHDKFCAKFYELTETIHYYDSKCAMQLHHAGRQTNPAMSGHVALGPSSVPCRLIGAPVKEMSTDEIDEIIAAYGSAAHRAVLSGFDAVEIHGAHGYLPGQFLSPYSNRRTDDYGGSPENRLRFVIRLIREIRQNVGPGFPIIYRHSADEFLKGGLTIEDSVHIAEALEKEGVDALHISGGCFDSVFEIPVDEAGYGFTAGAIGYWVAPTYVARGHLLDFASRIKQAVKIPVIAVGGLTPDMAENALIEGKADMAALGRALIADPHLPRKLAQRHETQIRPCIRCNTCLSQVLKFLPLRCAVNPEAAQEYKMETETLPDLARVLIVGGGPAGMEAARFFAHRGIRVELFEKNDWLGGQLRYAGVPHFKNDILQLVTWYENELERLGVDVTLNKELTADEIVERDPELVIIATGAVPMQPKLGSSKGPQVVMAHDILEGMIPRGNRIVVLGGGLVGCEVAEFLIEKNPHINITILEMQQDIALNMEMVSRAFLIQKLALNKVKWLSGAKFQEITEEGVIYTDSSHPQQSLSADTVIIALGMRPLKDLYNDLKSKGLRVMALGDCSLSPLEINKGGGIYHAINTCFWKLQRGLF